MRLFWLLLAGYSVSICLSLSLSLVLCFHFTVESKHSLHRMWSHYGPETETIAFIYALIVPICGTNIIGNIRFRIRLCERLWHAYCCCYLCYSRASARQYMTLNGLSKWNFPSTFLAVICLLLLLRRRYMYANGSVSICQDIICYIYYIWFIKFMVYKSNARIFIQFWCVYTKGCSPHFLFIFLYSFRCLSLNDWIIYFFLYFIVFNIPHEHW